MADIILETKELTKCYGEITAVRNLDLKIRQGEVFGLLGPNGAGKTTTTRMLLGLTAPTHGWALIDGHDCTREPLAVKRLVGYLPDAVGFYPELTGRENLRFTGRLNGLSTSVCECRIERLLERVGMTDAADRKAGTYSRGMKQRLGIADVLMKDPRVIIMDEPTLGIDPEGMRVLMRLIRELAEQDGRTVLISSHQLYQVQQICDRVGIFVKGQLIACGGIQDLGRQLENEGSYTLELGVEPADEGIVKQLAALTGVRAVERTADGSLRLEADRDVRREAAALIVQQGRKLLQLQQRGGDLDEIYRKYFEKAGEQDDSTEPIADQSKITAILRKHKNARR